MDMTPIQDRPVSIDAATLERAARMIKVLGHPLRLKILEALERGELNVAELQEAAGASQALVSQQLGILRAHGIVEPRRDGPRVFYRVIEPKVSRILDCIRECDVSTMAEFTTLTAYTGFELPRADGHGDRNVDGPATGRRSRRSPRAHATAS